MDWEAQGRKDRRQAVPIAGAPGPEDTIHGRQWRKGWQEEDTRIEASRQEMAPIEVQMRDGKLFLVDGDGRILGNQSGIILQQDEDGLSASVTFVQLDLTHA